MYRRFFLLIAFVWSATHVLANDPMPASAEDPILTISLADTTHRLDHNALRSLPVDSFDTTTIWTDGVQGFAGLRMATLLERLGVAEGLVTLTAANGYQITIPVSEFTPDGALLAYERNGKPMTLRDKGPVWLVYPFDVDDRFRTEYVYANSIWQLDRIDITP